MTLASHTIMRSGTAGTVKLMAAVLAMPTVRYEGGRRVEVMLPNNAVGRSSKFFEPGDAVQIAWRDDAGHYLHD